MALTARNPFLNLTPDAYASDSDASAPLPVPGRPRLLASGPMPLGRIGAPQVGNIITQPLSRLPQLTDSRIKDSSGPALGRLPSRILAPSTDMSMPSEPMQRLGRQRTESNRLESTGDGISQIKNPFLRGLARVGDIAGTVLAPNVAAAIPGTSLHHRVLEGQQAQLIGQTEDSLKDDADIQQRQALAAQERAKARQLDNPMPKPGQLLYDKNGSAIGYQDGYGQYFGPDDEALPERLRTIPADYRSQLFGPEQNVQLERIANTSNLLAKDFNPSGSGKLGQKLAEAAALIPTGGAPVLQYPIARAMTSPRVVEYLMAPSKPNPLFFNVGAASGSQAGKKEPRRVRR